MKIDTGFQITLGAVIFSNNFCGLWLAILTTVAAKSSFRYWTYFLVRLFCSATADHGDSNSVVLEQVASAYRT